MAHTSDGRYTYVNDAHSSAVYRIDNMSNEVVDDTSAGVVGPYGLVLDWDEHYLYPIGKGEGSHNNGSVVGIVDARTFTTPRNFRHNMPIYLGGSASSIDHGILHPDPNVNELWISNMNGWETIVLDLNKLEVKTYIPTPNGGDTHSGGFARYTPDWKGELLADMGGPKAAMRATMRQRAAAAQPSPRPRLRPPMQARSRVRCSSRRRRAAWAVRCVTARTRGEARSSTRPISAGRPRIGCGPLSRASSS